MNRLADLLVARRGLIALAVLALSGLAVVGVLTLDFDDIPRNMFVSDDDEFTFLETLFDDFGSDDNDCVIVVTGEDLFSPAPLASLRTLVDRVGRIEGVDSVYSMLDAVAFQPGRLLPRSLLPAAGAPVEAHREARREVLDHPLLAGHLVAIDGSTTIVIARLHGDRLSVTEMSPVVSDIRHAIRAIAENGDVSMALTGIPTIRTELFELIPREQGKFFVVGGALALMVAFVLFGRLTALAIVGAAAWVGALWTMGAMGLVGEKVNVLNSIVPTLVLVVGLTDAVHLLYDIRSSRRAGLAPLPAAGNAIRHLGPACGLTSLTTAIGFASLSVASVPIVRRLGMTCGIGVALALASVLLIVPLLTSTRLGNHIERKKPSAIMTRFAPLCRSCMDKIVRQAKWICATALVVTIVLIVVALQLKPSCSITESMPSDGESTLALRHCDDVFGGMMTASVLVEWPEDKTLASPDVLAVLEAVSELLRAEPKFRHPLSVVDLLRVLPGDGELSDRVPMLGMVPTPLRHRFVREDKRRALVTVRHQDEGSAVHEPVFARLDSNLETLQARYPGFSIRATGMTVLAVHQLNRMIRDLAASLGLAAIVIFGVMALALRSIRWGLICVLPNIFPLAVTAAFLVVTGRYLELTSVIVFSICLGVAVDDTIHFMMRYRRELAVDGDVGEALLRTFVSVGGALLTTTAILLAGFGSVMISVMPSMRLFGTLSCLALVAALIGDLIVLPALLACFTRPRHVPTSRDSLRE